MKTLLVSSLLNLSVKSNLLRISLVFASFGSFLTAVPRPKEFSAHTAVKKGDMSGQWLLRHPVLTGDRKREIKIIIDKERISNENISGYKLQTIEGSQKVSDDLGLPFPDLISVIPDNEGKLPYFRFFYICSQPVTKIDEKGNEMVSIHKFIKAEDIQIRQIEGKVIYFENDSDKKLLPDELKLEWIRH